MKLTETALAVLERRYQRRDEKGELIETAEELFERVCRAVALGDEKHYEGFYEMLTGLYFLPNSPTLMNAGVEEGQLSACFVLPIEDSMESIFNTLRDAAIIHKTGGGTGFNFSRLRGTGSVVRSTGGIASGPISFMEAYDAATETVKQGGKRRGANMGMLRVDHPDILEFIDCKRDLTKLQNFNISIAITDEFMAALSMDGESTNMYAEGQVVETVEHGSYSIICPKTGNVLRTQNAKEVWDKIIESAWSSGEPGVFFIDRANKFNPTPHLGDFESTNPCGEQPLLPYESCNLGSINLHAFWRQDALSFDWDMLDYIVRRAVYFLNNVIDINHYPLQQIEDATKATRKIGLGVMGWADLLLEMNIRYGSEEACKLARKIMKRITNKAQEVSRNLAVTPGPYPAYQEGCPRQRNAAVTTIAPTGTISMLAGCSGGIEPIFGFVYRTNCMDDDSFINVDKILLRKLKELNLNTPEILNKLADTGLVSTMTELPQEIRDVFVCAHDVTPEEHIRMQAAFQEYTDNAISKTINFSSKATREDFDKGYRLAYKLGCKGMTAYRDGCRANQTLTMGTTKVTEEPTAKSKPRPRAKTLEGFTEKVATGCGNLYVTVNSDKEGLCEILTNAGKAGGCYAQSEAMARLVTLALRSNVDPSAVAKQLRGIRCPSAIKSKTSECTSCPDAIGKALHNALKSRGEDDNIGEPTGIHCPDCNEPLATLEGCLICRSCGYSKCS